MGIFGRSSLNPEGKVDKRSAGAQIDKLNITLGMMSLSATMVHIEYSRFAIICLHPSHKSTYFISGDTNFTEGLPATSRRTRCKCCEG